MTTKLSYKLKVKQSRQPRTSIQQFFCYSCCGLRGELDVVHVCRLYSPVLWWLWDVWSPRPCLSPLYVRHEDDPGDKLPRWCRQRIVSLVGDVHSKRVWGKHRTTCTHTDTHTQSSTQIMLQHLQAVFLPLTWIRNDILLKYNAQRYKYQIQVHCIQLEICWNIPCVSTT